MKSWLLRRALLRSNSWCSSSNSWWCKRRDRPVMKKMTMRTSQTLMKNNRSLSNRSTSNILRNRYRSCQANRIRARIKRNNIQRMHIKPNLKGGLKVQSRRIIRSSILRASHRKYQHLRWARGNWQSKKRSTMKVKRMIIVNPTKMNLIFQMYKSPSNSSQCLKAL